MTRTLAWMLALLALMTLLVACAEEGTSGSDDDIPIYRPDGDIPGEDGDEPQEDGDEPIDEDGDEPQEDGDEPGEDGDEPDDTFNPENPGISMLFFIGFIEMMGEGQEISIATVTPATREEFEGPGGDVPTQQPIDTCDFSSGGGSERPNECNTDADCAPEQICHTDDESGQRRCRTPVEPLDVGPIYVDGFTGGRRTFAYNPSQSGAYTENGQGDGQLQPGSIAFDTTYTITGQGDMSQGLGSFTGTVDAPARITLTSPQPQPTDMGMMAIPINLSQDLLLRWQGSGNPENTMTITFSGMNGSVTCFLSDDGEHLVYRDLLGHVGFNPDPFWAIMNMVLIQSDAYGEIRGEGITRNETSFQQIIMFNATLVQ